MPKLGLTMPDDVVNALFDQYDADGSGVLDFKELQKVLREGPSKGDPVKALKTKPLTAKRSGLRQRQTSQGLRRIQVPSCSSRH